MDKNLTITFDRLSAQIILNAFIEEKKECFFCGKEVNRNNLAGVIRNGLFCNDMDCLNVVARIIKAK